MPRTNILTRHPPRSRSLLLSVMLLSAAGAITSARQAQAGDVYLPAVLPITGFMSVEGGSQHNGAVMAVENAPAGLKVDAPVFDTGTSASGAATALDKALSQKQAVAAVASVFGTEMVAMVPVSKDYKVPLLTLSGLAKLTESGNPYVFRFLPNDREIKVAHARYVVEVLKKAKIALIGDTTAYGQGGFQLLKENFAKLHVTPVMAESVEPDAKDMSAILNKVKGSGADVIVIHTVEQPMALLIKQARAAGIDLPVVNSSSLVEPTATALFDPKELKGSCAETASAPETRGTPELRVWADAYKARFHEEPDGAALGMYDGVMMTLSVIAKGANTPAAIVEALKTTDYKGIAMNYRSNGHGDMAHDADIVCWDGTSRIPKVVEHYSGAGLILQ